MPCYFVWICFLYLHRFRGKDERLRHITQFLQLNYYSSIIV
nr:MAG TPA: hypothetical protein [Caudoviricetes sp.]